MSLTRSGYRCRASGPVGRGDDHRTQGKPQDAEDHDRGGNEEGAAADEGAVAGLFEKHPGITHCIHLAYLMSAEVEANPRLGVQAGHARVAAGG